MVTNNGVWLGHRKRSGGTKWLLPAPGRPVSSAAPFHISLSQGAQAALLITCWWIRWERAI